MPITALPPLDERLPLPAEHTRTYQNRGHVLLREVASTEEVDAYRGAIRAAALRRSDETRSLAHRDTYGRAFLQVPNLWRHDEKVAAFSLAKRFAGVAADLLGVGQVRIYHDQALFKEPGGGLTPWHQDASYWPMEAERTLTMWMPLVDVEPEMGALSFARGSHTGGCLSEHLISDESERYFQELVDSGRFIVDGPTAMRRGDATFHNGWTLHRAHPNGSETMREVMTVIYVADGVRVTEPRTPEQYHDLATWLDGLRPGDEVGSPLNPALL